jgi:hypothetical protein
VCDSDCGVKIEEIADGEKRRNAGGSADGGEGYMNTTGQMSNHDNGGYT